jgi:3-methyladenine DNA glycosylase AlkC
MVQLLTQSHLEEISHLVVKISQGELSDIGYDLMNLIGEIRADIPPRKRISYGRYSIIKELSQEMALRLEETGVNLFQYGNGLFENQELDPFVRSYALGLISIYGLNSHDLKNTLPTFEAAASDENWIVRECASGLIKKLIKAFPEEMKKWYLALVKSKDPLKRRFGSESLRPVAENRWIHKQPEYALSIIKHLFRESDPYPRTSIGNSLSDWIRVNEELAYPIVEELAQNGDKNSYWIAYRACRNLVKKKPLLVMDLLGVNEYKYKKRIHKRSDYLETSAD